MGLVVIGWALILVELSSLLIRDVSGCGLSGAVSLQASSVEVGVFTSRNYPGRYYDDEDSCWVINAKEEGYSVMLETTHFELEYSKQSSCDDADYVDVRDGNSPTSALLRRLCGVMHANFTSTSRYMFVRFRTDQSISMSGFYMRYWAVPSGSVTALPTSNDCLDMSRLTAYESTVLEIISPSFPNGYPALLDKCWLLEAIAAEYVVRVEIVESELENSYSCTAGDYMEARDGSSISDKLLDQWCGSMHPSHLTSSGRNMMLRFHTDQTANDFRGFRIRYSSVDHANPDNGYLSFDTSSRILVGVGVIVTLLFIVIAIFAYHKKAAAHRSPAGSRSRHGRQRTSVERLFDYPQHQLTPLGPLQAPPPYQSCGRPASHLGFGAPQQPGYRPTQWSNTGRDANNVELRNGGVLTASLPPVYMHSESDPAGLPGRLNHLYPPGTPLPVEPPAYEEIVKELEGRDLTEYGDVHPLGIPEETSSTSNDQDDLGVQTCRRVLPTAPDFGR